MAFAVLLRVKALLSTVLVSMGVMMVELFVRKKHEKGGKGLLV